MNFQCAENRRLFLAFSVRNQSFRDVAGKDDSPLKRLTIDEQSIISNPDQGLVVLPTWSQNDTLPASKVGDGVSDLKDLFAYRAYIWDRMDH